MITITRQQARQFILAKQGLDFMITEQDQSKRRAVK